MISYNKLVVFGSSDTYGQGLPDSVNQNLAIDNKPSAFSWPSLLGQKLNIPVVNCARPGASNKEILLTILSSDVQPSDLVINYWTHANRSLLLKQDNSILQLLPKSTSPEANTFYRTFDRKNLTFNTLLEVSHASLFLKNKNITFYNFYTDIAIDIFKQSFKHLHQMADPFLYVDKQKYYTDLGLDKLHMGLKSHEILSNIIYDKLNE